MRLHYTFLFFALFLSAVGFAQPANDECINATPLTDVSNWCSAIAEFSNIGATESPEPSPFCFPTIQENNDVWFSFVAIAPDINISVIGAIAVNPGGTLTLPQLALYEGDCGNLNEIECISDAFNNNAVQTFGGPLNVGETYYIRVSARVGATGTFELCVNNFNQVPEPSGDCPTGVILCDKSPFTVDFVTGVGSITGEIGNVSCNSATCQITESSSSWYKWTCDEAGTLTFSLTPLNPADDLDFVLYELPGGLDDCNGKLNLRCMASGENVGEPLPNWINCTGATGLMTGDTDATERCGCQPGDNNFVGEIIMTPGASYALVVNNFSNSGSGFSVQFGGTGTFLGPEAAFTTDEPDDTLCIGESIRFTDESTFIGTITDWEWDFGPGAIPATANTQGPHVVQYDRPGVKNILLKVTTTRGCFITTIDQITVECCDDHFDVSGLITDESCPGDLTGAIDLTVTNDYAPYTYVWDNMVLTEDQTGIGQAEYTVTISDAATCDTVLTYAIGGPPPFEFDTLVVMPTCNGGVDGAVTLVVEGGTPPYQYNWENSGFTNDNTLSNISQGDYEVVVRDQNGCEETLILPVTELILELDPAVQAFSSPSCTGFSDGSIQVNIVNGLPPYQYDFNDGNGFVDESVLENLPAGSYTVEVLDANLCRGFFEFELVDPLPLEVILQPEDASCFGEDDGRITAIVSGGTGDYFYNWSDGQTNEIADNLTAGTYTVTITDENDCELIATTEVLEPQPVFIEVGDITDVICFGDSTGVVSVIGSGGVPPYTYSVDGTNFQADSIFTNLFAGTYTFTVMDTEGCTETVEATVTQPPELLVDAGADQFIDLGFFTDLQATPNDLFVDYQWFPDLFINCDTCARVTVNPVETTTYDITVTNSDGCTATDEVTVFVVKNRPVYIPNVFSPNDDGINDIFTAYTGPAALLINNMKIFDRWGELIYDQDNLPPNSNTEGWDGTFKGEPMSSAVFVYLIEIRFVDNIVVQYSGDVTLLR
jgi:gliding motility-associated-like protein